ncbi:glycosyltransferase family 2 protein [Blautia faecis]|uniref:glycosyltransferase family 2 protein n=1 Tax=Blautia faecis TaxID=871665 RepID=UPI001D0242DD|nr:glycosyltransferase [Blautia faecis]MCB5434345.1 glycosyltransferase [Blautia faecis]
MEDIRHKISVVLPIYNESVEMVSEALNSIQKQSFSDIEILVILDNPMNYNLIDYIEKCCKEDKRIKFIINEKNLGLPLSLNKAIKMAKYDLIARMDADDISYPKRLEVQLGELLRRDLDLIGCNIVRFTENKILDFSNYPTSTKAINKSIMYTSVIAHPTWLIRRDVFNRVGLYRDFYSCEDYDFLLRSRKKEIKMGNVKDVLLKYRVNQFSISNSNKSYQRLVSNFLRKNYERVEDITKEDIVDYIDSNMGRKNYQSIENYYEKREKSKLLQGKNELLSKINLLSYMFSKVAWDNLIASIMPNIYRRLYK